MYGPRYNVVDVPTMKMIQKIYSDMLPPGRMKPWPMSESDELENDEEEATTTDVKEIGAAEMDIPHAPVGTTVPAK